MSNYICFKDYNDYELIYLIREGNEQALYFFFEKYEKIIKKIICSYIKFNDYRFEDFLQEGRMLLYESIYKYEVSSNTSFFTYFIIILKRRLYKLVGNDEYEKVVFRDMNIDYIPHETTIKYYGRYFFQDKLKIKLFDKCIIGNMKVVDFAKKYKISYYRAYYNYKKAIEELKEIFSENEK